jgi:hypothetical protein
LTAVMEGPDTAPRGAGTQQQGVLPLHNVWCAA